MASIKQLKSKCFQDVLLDVEIGIGETFRYLG